MHLSCPRPLQISSILIVNILDPSHDTLLRPSLILLKCAPVFPNLTVGELTRSAAQFLLHLRA